MLMKWRIFLQENMLDDWLFWTFWTQDWKTVWFKWL